MKQPDLGLKIIDLRQTKGLTQEELVNLCNISVRTLQRIESGEVEPRGYTLRLISKALDFNFLSLSQNDSEQVSKEIKSLKSDNMSNLEKTRDILIERFALLSNSSVDKIKSKLEINPIGKSSARCPRAPGEFAPLNQNKAAPLVQNKNAPCQIRFRQGIF